MKRITCALFLGALLFPLAAEEASVLGENVLRITLAPVVFGFAGDEWDDQGQRKKFDGIGFYNMGLGAEYGVTGALTAFVQWAPGANLWSDGPDGGEIGPLSDVFLGGKGQIIGGEGPVRREDMRLSAALAVKAPLPSGKNTVRELDSHLWGLAARAYYDYVFFPFFFLNGYTEFIYYPEQRADNPNFGSGRVYHPLDITIEIEPRFVWDVAEGIRLVAGIPLTYRVAPETTLDGRGLGNDRHRFSIGPNAGILLSQFAVRDFSLPFELDLGFDIAAAGKNDAAINRFTLLIKLMPPLPARR
ncbi:MAG: hypothetical protein LBQ55_09255 [Treponema sp.]|jgi:hypothetical protein|nr:hypothetical protein [Treponema sp.]